MLFFIFTLLYLLIIANSWKSILFITFESLDFIFTKNILGNGHYSLSFFFFEFMLFPMSRRITFIFLVVLWSHKNAESASAPPFRCRKDMCTLTSQKSVQESLNGSCASNFWKWHWLIRLLMQQQRSFPHHAAKTIYFEISVWMNSYVIHSTATRTEHTHLIWKF